MTTQNTNLDLQLVPLRQESLSENVILKLEAALTQSAFGHEYALIRLAEETSSYSNREEIYAQMEAHKNLYFLARAKLSEIDPHRLEEVESGLKAQKEAVLRDKLILH